MNLVMLYWLRLVLTLGQIIAKVAGFVHMDVLNFMYIIVLKTIPGIDEEVQSS